MTRGNGAWDIVTAKFFPVSSAATVWTFSASSTVCKFIKSTFARTTISTEGFIAGIYTIFPQTLQFFPFSTDRSCRYFTLHVTHCCVWRTMSKSAVQSISAGTRKHVLSLLMMPMYLLTHLWNGGIATRACCREMKLLLAYTMMMSSDQDVLWTITSRRWCSMLLWTSLSYFLLLFSYKCVDYDLRKVISLDYNLKTVLAMPSISRRWSSFSFKRRSTSTNTWYLY